MPQQLPALELITNKTFKDLPTVVREVHDAQQGAVGALAARQFGPSAQWIVESAKAIFDVIDERAQALLIAAVRALKARPPSAGDRTWLDEATDFLLADLDRYYKAGADQMKGLRQAIPFEDPPGADFEDHRRQLRKRLKAELEMELQDVQQSAQTARATGKQDSQSGPYSAIVYRVMIASPSDVQSERSIAREVIDDWNAAHSEATGIVLLPLTWEKNSTPVQGDRPQGIINRQVLAKADLLVAIFHSRIGSPTGVAPSGTVEELTEHLNAGKLALVYFSEAPLPNDVNPQQVEAVRAFRAEARRHGIQWSYKNAEEFRSEFSRHLASTVAREPLFKAAAPVPRDVAAEPELSAEGEQLLVAAADAPDGQIVVARAAAGGGGVWAGQFRKGLTGEAREFAEWEGVVQELRRSGYVHELERDVFGVTREGFAAADRIRPGGVPR